MAAPGGDGSGGKGAKTFNAAVSARASLLKNRGIAAHALAAAVTWSAFLRVIRVDILGSSVGRSLLSLAGRVKIANYRVNNDGYSVPLNFLPYVNGYRNHVQNWRNITVGWWWLKQVWLDK